ncbi:hypothetical protein SRHO_G00001880 [Serrasalmus rhombeus]
MHKPGPPGTLAAGAGLRVLILSRSPRKDRHPQLRQYARTFTQSRDGFGLEAQAGGKVFARAHRPRHFVFERNGRPKVQPARDFLTKITTTYFSSPLKKAGSFII